MATCRLLILLLLVGLGGAAAAGAAENGLAKVLPAPACAEGWRLDGKVALFDRDNLFDRINGEAELYFPYGFDLLAYGRYASRQDPRIAVDADVYRMGSLLDAFGLYASYRKKDDPEVAVGAEGTVSAGQLFFYQDRYFVRLQVTGTPSLRQDVFLSCAKAIARNLPAGFGRPRELEALQVPAVAPKSIRYLAQSLLGYEFFRRGLMAEATLDGGPVQVFLVLEESPEAARTAFDRYQAYLRPTDPKLRLTAEAERTAFTAVDPLYGNVVVEQVGSFVVGAVRVGDPAAACALIGQVRHRLGR